MLKKFQEPAMKNKFSSINKLQKNSQMGIILVPIIKMKKKYYRIIWKEI